MSGTRGTLAEQLSALMDYRNRRETIEPIGSSWTVVASNDNASADEISNLSHERSLRVTPSVDEIMRQVETGDVERAPAREIEVVENGVAKKVKLPGAIVRIGNLRFSDGTQTEKDFKRGGDGKVAEYDRVMPVGAMLGCREKAEAALGEGVSGGAHLKRSNDFFAETLNTDPLYVVRRGGRRNGPGYSRDETQAMLDEAIANTKVMPQVKRYPAGLPSAYKRVADSFNGMKVSASGGNSGSIAWQDISDSIAQREVWDAALAEISESDKTALDTAMGARTWADISPGGTVQGARKRGKRKLTVANDNLSSAMKKHSA